ncbi:hypothetical protein GAY28_03735 [Azospirillum brasilense]|nr:hypothetical protein [Azospirillum brasilense]
MALVRRQIVTDYRKRHGLGQKWLADQCGMSLRSFQRVEGGDPMPVDVLNRVAKVINCDLRELIEPRVGSSEPRDVSRSHLSKELGIIGIPMYPVRRGVEILEAILLTTSYSVDYNLDPMSNDADDLIAIVACFENAGKKDDGGKAGPDLPVQEHIRRVAGINRCLELAEARGWTVHWGEFDGTDGTVGQVKVSRYSKSERCYVRQEDTAEYWEWRSLREYGPEPDDQAPWERAD